jgi:Flp pilus assembly protein TadG
VLHLFRKKLIKDERGMEALSFVIILPIFIGMVVMCLTLGMAVYARMSTELAAREAARTYAVNVNQGSGDSQAQSLARAAALSNLQGTLPGMPSAGGSNTYFNPASDVVINPSFVVDGDNNYCLVSVTTRVPIMAPFAEKLLGGTLVIGSKGQGNQYMETVTGSAVFEKEPTI